MSVWPRSRSPQPICRNRSRLPGWAGSPPTAPFAATPKRFGGRRSRSNATLGERRPQPESNRPDGLLPLEPGEQQRFLTGLVEFGKVVLHARLAAPAAGLDAGA